MTNFQVYRKTLSFSFVMFLTELLALLVFLGCCVAGFFIFTSMPLIGLLIGFVVGLLAIIPINIFLVNRVKAAQIAMMTKGVNEDALPDHTFKEGFNEIKGRFGSITVFFLITRAIKGIFQQIGRSINRIGTAIGGDVGNGVTSAIDSAIQTVIGYLCDCCLGWVLFRKDENPFKAGCEGAVIFFKHGKTLVRNIGRIFGMSFLFFILIGGAFFGIFFLIFSAIPNMFTTLSQEIAKTGSDAPEFLANPTIFIIVAAAFGGIVMWGILHSILVRPFILVGVLRNFMAAGKANVPNPKDFTELENKYPKFAKLYQKAESN